MKKTFLTVIIIFAAIFAGLKISEKIAEKESDANQRVCVGVLLNGSASDRSYSQSHYDAISMTARELDLDIILRESVSMEGTNAYDTIEELISQGCSIIICNSFDFSEAVSIAADNYPDVCFLHATGTSSGKNLATFFGRMYQIRYLTGIAAGMQTKTNEIGYIAAFDIPEVNRGINAFTLGVRSVNPEAVVYVDRSGSWNDEALSEASAQRLISNHNIDVLAMHTDALSPLEAADRNGIWSIGYNYDNSSSYPDTYLTAAVWNWENIYTELINHRLQGTFSGKHYWQGIDTGIASVTAVSPKADKDIAARIAQEKARIESGSFDVFYGPVTDNEGNLRIAEGESMSDKNMLDSFDWYVEGVSIDEQNS